MLEPEIKETEELINSLRFKENRDFQIVTVCQKLLEMIKELAKEIESDSRDHGCLCQRCGQRYRVDLMVPDDLWGEIHGSFNLLCGPCLTELIEARNEFDYFQLGKTG